MSDAPENPTPANVPANPSANAPTGRANPEPSDSADLGDSGKKALDAERRRASQAEREAKALREQLDQIEAAKLSDLEKAQKEAANAKAEVEMARAEVLRYRVAAKHGISDEDAALFLTASDEDTLTKQAERLATRVADATKPRSPMPDLTQGRADAQPVTAPGLARLREAYASK